MQCPSSLRAKTGRESVEFAKRKWYNRLILVTGRCGTVRVLGIDPGYAIVGFGALDYEKNKFSVVRYGAIRSV